MYKWPQGRVIRTIALVLVLVIVADLGWNGARSQLLLYAEAGRLNQAIFGGIYATLALGVLVAGWVAIMVKPVSADFLIEVEQEMTRVTWPTTNELIRSTVVIAIMIAVLGTVIFAVDWFNHSVLFEALYKRGA